MYQKSVKASLIHQKSVKACIKTVPVMQLKMELTKRKQETFA
jgi:hypothetical protein